VQESLRKSGGFPLPTARETVAKAASFPPLVVLMIPEGDPGNLETLCVDAALDKWPAILAPLATFVGATPPTGWLIGKQDKMKLQTILAATCEDRPESGFVGHWYEREQFHIPLDHYAFDDIEKFLRGFRKLVGM
jgi:hypothetical protein